jgi:uncharacterized protein (DUF433 family)
MWSIYSGRLIGVRGEVDMKFERIAVDPEICTGKPCIKHARFPVTRVPGLLASGETKESIQKAYPYLEPEDIDESFLCLDKQLV